AVRGVQYQQTYYGNAGMGGAALPRPAADLPASLHLHTGVVAVAAQPSLPVSEHQNPKAFEAVARYVRAITNGALALAATFFCIALIGLTIDIIMRYAANSSVRGMQEIVNLLFGWIYMLGVAALYARKGDAAITFITRSMPEKLQNALAIFVSL